MKTLHLICAARPNFMKIAPLYHALKNENWCDVQIIHTGQHYDYQMSQTFFDDLGLPTPRYHLEIGSGTHAEQTAQTMMSYERLCLEKSRPDLVIVVGDVNATLACSVAAKKLHLKVAHLEAGLRSFDRTMPEEINRVITDSISDYHWTPSKDANENLLKEGLNPDQISFVGNIMIDTYCMMQPQIKEKKTYQRYEVEPQNYVILTLHRPTNVDSEQSLQNIFKKLSQIDFPIIFPAHPRTKKMLKTLKELPGNLKIIEPLGYLDFMSLVSNSAYVISDSGGIQEETTYLGIPCFTLRETTERPITITLGSNQLVTIGTLLDKLNQPKKGITPPLWDGNTAQRLKKIIQEII
ncbi:MAG: UDP-N-acetylglucosamine 2-epimerase (non-hydrolyzing) [Alphaproteobacteria bacterium 16-39-46]|nr:MAG: UDP-N-acetylglucosamine 2-epimerase (non-hydrolyzing) [Alphaproteobacteria bacterium 16-39-46]OZA44507.1 MAG: UDP-N-acetylglucosamine 2-epimerase (non-hydrolyzing) [Alphaproteobacteria bacterium 17-39-52]HQS83354.1 UDP-N-acetylglucosamine 2-epimerase (non-hydrolyzing) [Alphaproteobacteria bacterium]HQS93041.1 UDP-N-acetylglucosamine 2-epimerase (non-hydrolyzing) [Alphaproteobacteria bacterium]